MNEVIVRQAILADAMLVHKLGHQCYRETYPGILTDAQIDFMLDKNYTVTAIQNLMQSGQDFYLLFVDDIPQGFVAVQAKDAETLRIEKLYLLQVVKGRGYGRYLLDFAARLAFSVGARALELNVNRGNPAYHFYLKQGFVVTEIVDIPYFGYVLDDYVMQKPIGS